MDTLGHEIVAKCIVKHYLSEDKLRTAEITLNREANSSRLDDSDRAVMGSVDENSL
jgi:hypothetical protein